MPTWNQFAFQDAQSPVMEEFIHFHDFVCVTLGFILTVVGVTLIQVIRSQWMNLSLVEGQSIEFIWTVAPALILVVIAVPSLALLYSLEDADSSVLTLKAIGHQWYWSYEYTDFWLQQPESFVSFDSFMLPSDESTFRLLDVDNRVTLPFLTQIRVLISSADVLHSWAVPSLGVKGDANPGRLNQASFLSYRPGLAYGQCSEICGANHSFMPIALEFVSGKDFLGWVSTFMD